MADQARSRVGTGWKETYLGGSPESEQALFAAAFPRVQEIQETVAKSQQTPVRRAFHNKGLPLQVEFEVAPDLPHYLQVCFLRPGATYSGFGRFSRSQSFHRTDGELDQRGFAFRLETDLGPQDILLSNTPVSFARDPVMFLIVAAAFVENPKLLAPLHLVRPLGIGGTIRVLANLLRPPDRTVAFTSQRYWSRTPFQFGEAAARLMVRPVGEVRRVNETRSPDFLTEDLTRDLRLNARSFELYAQLFVDETNTPIEDASREWREADAPPVVLGRVVLPRQDLDTEAARALADRVEGSEALSPFNTPCLRPLGRTNRGRLEGYRRSASRRGASPTVGAASGSRQP